MLDDAILGEALLPQGAPIPVPLSVEGIECQPLHPAKLSSETKYSGSIEESD